jgi:DNA-binding response OmpR family regulator
MNASTSLTSCTAEVKPRPFRLLRNRHILIVEDEFILAHELKAALLEAGAVVVGPACTLAAALRFAEDSHLEAAVLDIHLGSVNALPVADLLARRGVPFLFQTSDAAFPRGMHAAAPVLVKPFRPERLLGTLSGLLPH